MEIGKDAVVIIEYTVRLADGAFVRGSETTPASMSFVCGYGEALPALEARLLGMEEGAEASFVIPAAEGFGERDPNLVRRRDFKEYPVGRTLVPGKWAVGTDPRTGATVSHFVVARDEDGVTLDDNHPLAGRDLHYRVRVAAVRAALPEELAHIRPCETEERAETERRDGGT